MELRELKTKKNLMTAFAGESEAEEAVELCPVCKHPKSFFFIKAKNY